MYARNVTIHLKPNAARQFSRKVEDQLLPLLRKREGFTDEMALVAPDGKQAMAISFWDSKEHADAYNREAYPEVLKGMADVIEGTPVVSGFEVANSTLHKIPTGK